MYTATQNIPALTGYGLNKLYPEEGTSSTNHISYQEQRIIKYIQDQSSGQEAFEFHRRKGY